MRVQVLSDAYAAMFRRYATTAQAEYVTNALRGPAQDEFIRMRQLANDSPFDNKMATVTGPQWFEAATRYVDALNGTEHRLVDDFMAAVIGATEGGRL